jgi:hypothetical protein
MSARIGFISNLLEVFSSLCSILLSWTARAPASAAPAQPQVDAGILRLSDPRHKPGMASGHANGR